MVLASSNHITRLQYQNHPTRLQLYAHPTLLYTPHATLHSMCATHRAASRGMRIYLHIHTCILHVCLETGFTCGDVALLMLTGYGPWWFFSFPSFITYKYFYLSNYSSREVWSLSSVLSTVLTVHALHGLSSILPSLYLLYYQSSMLYVLLYSWSVKCDSIPPPYPRPPTSDTHMCVHSVKTDRPGCECRELQTKQDSKNILE